MGIYNNNNNLNETNILIIVLFHLAFETTTYILYKVNQSKHSRFINN